jgi:hypothetical protein
MSSRKVQSTVHTAASSSTTKISGCGAADIWSPKSEKCWSLTATWEDRRLRSSQGRESCRICVTIR